MSEGTSIYYRDDVFDRALKSRLVPAMVQEKTVTGDCETNFFHFPDFELGSVGTTREGAPVGERPIDVSSSQIKKYFTTMRALDFEYGGNRIISNDF